MSKVLNKFADVWPITQTFEQRCRLPSKLHNRFPFPSYPLPSVLSLRHLDIWNNLLCVLEQHLVLSLIGLLGQSRFFLQKLCITLKKLCRFVKSSALFCQSSVDSSTALHYFGIVLQICLGLCIILSKFCRFVKSSAFFGNSFAFLPKLLYF